ncbi:hypothetical protein BH20ACI3_BH20ACI3_06480 [soil metagenome]
MGNGRSLSTLVDGSNCCPFIIDVPLNSANLAVHIGDVSDWIKDLWEESGMLES